LVRGQAGYKRDLRVEARLERVLDGGPIWSYEETQQLCDDVRKDLETEFGPSLEDDTIPVVAEGWPFSGSDRPRTEADVLARRAEYAKERREYERARDWAADAERDRLKAIEKAVKTAAEKAAEIAERKRRSAERIAAKIDAWNAIQQGADINPDTTLWALRSTERDDQWWMDRSSRSVLAYRSERIAKLAMIATGRADVMVAFLPQAKRALIVAESEIQVTLAAHDHSGDGDSNARTAAQRIVQRDGIETARTNALRAYDLTETDARVLVCASKRLAVDVPRISVERLRQRGFLEQRAAAASARGVRVASILEIVGFDG
jgi:hypothetical protein